MRPNAMRPNPWIAFTIRVALAVAAVIGVGLAFTFEQPAVQTVQTGYRGIGMAQIYNEVALENQVAATRLPEPAPPIDKAGVPSSQAYQNVQVLGNLDANEFIRLMGAITEWVSPEQGCAYCHAEGEELSSDSLYTKRVARRMLQMTQHINQDWANHVGQTGVTCYTCHRGRPVPANVWFEQPERGPEQGLVGNQANQNRAAENAGLSSLPADPFTPFLTRDPERAIRVISATALPAGNDKSIKQTEWTYGLMMHMSTSLGVNCTFCHNSRAFADWSQSSPRRATSWYGIRMVADLNATYLVPLKPEYPHARLGPLGDAPKANCATCHAGAYRPLYGYRMLEAYPELATTGTARQ